MGSSRSRVIQVVRGKKHRRRVTEERKRETRMRKKEIVREYSGREMIRLRYRK